MNTALEEIQPLLGIPGRISRHVRTVGTAANADTRSPLYDVSLPAIPYERYLPA